MFLLPDRQLRNEELFSVNGNKDKRNEGNYKGDKLFMTFKFFYKERILKYLIIV